MRSQLSFEPHPFIMVLRLEAGYTFAPRTSRTSLDKPEWAMDYPDAGHGYIPRFGPDDSRTTQLKLPGRVTDEWWISLKHFNPSGPETGPTKDHPGRLPEEPRTSHGSPWTTPGRAKDEPWITRTTPGRAKDEPRITSLSGEMWLGLYNTININMTKCEH